MPFRVPSINLPEFERQKVLVSILEDSRNCVLVSASVLSPSNEIEKGALRYLLDEIDPDFLLFYAKSHVSVSGSWVGSGFVMPRLVGKINADESSRPDGTFPFFTSAEQIAAGKRRSQADETNKGSRDCGMHFR